MILLDSCDLQINQGSVLVGSISRKLTKSFSFIWFLLKILFSKSPCFLLILFFSFSFLFFWDKEKLVFRFVNLPTSFYRLSLCAYDPHNHYAIVKVLRGAKVWPWFKIWFVRISVFSSIKLWRHCWGGIGIFTDLLKKNFVSCV